MLGQPQEASAKQTDADRSLTNGFAPPSLDGILQSTLQQSQMDAVGIYYLQAEGARPVKTGFGIGMPDAFMSAYEARGARLDPILAQVLKTGFPCATTSKKLESDWRRSDLYLQISSHYGLLGYVIFPLYNAEKMVGALYFGCTEERTLANLEPENLLNVSSVASRISTVLLRSPLNAWRLTRRQNEVAYLAAQGLSNKQIAKSLSTGEAAVQKHLKALNLLFDTHSRTAMTAAWRGDI